jgi:hypothetical protein
MVSIASREGIIGKCGREMMSDEVDWFLGF